MNTVKGIARVTAAGAVVGIAIGLFSVGAADADTFVPLPGGDVTRTLEDGTVVHVTLSGESANINPSMGGTPLHRNAWVSGHGEVNISDGDAGDPSAFTRLRPGYVVGCQVDLSDGFTPGVNGSASGSVSTDSSGKPSVSGSVTPGASADLTLTAGQAQSFYVLDLESADDFGADSHDNRHSAKGGHNSVTWKDETIAVNGCGGAAQARAFVEVMVYTPTVTGHVTLWGAPFGIG
ncbi:MspA family porin [Nocardia sp. alder85J]|uniref:MspA family porin n=1 Tax=Nocardia sp. alder85J TaxID=2862949 RepID=UPI001CD4A3F2|nr:MspA family porin [Nocardia sp. alder85J]MCX4093255.1 MspA family porin [Nocardia sp. alder85J]